MLTTLYCSTLARDTAVAMAGLDWLEKLDEQERPDRMGQPSEARQGQRPRAVQEELDRMERAGWAKYDKSKVYSRKVAANKIKPNQRKPAPPAKPAKPPTVVKPAISRCK